ncbi:MAG: hypothetical protein LH603_11305 [Pseudonocardia sp.]|nr:hypothetical protein [Pseudonocardia sp.]
MVELNRSLALVTAGRLGDARALAESVLDRARRQQHGYLAARSIAVLGSAASKEGDYRRMTTLAERADSELPESEWRFTAGSRLTSVLRAYGAWLRAEPAACLTLLDSVARPADSWADRIADNLQPMRGTAVAPRR